MKTRIVPASLLRHSLRFDGSYHNAEMNIYADIIESHPHNTLSNLCSEIFTSGRNKRVYTSSEFGNPFLSNSDVVAADPLASCNYSSKKYGTDERAMLKGGMILTGRVGAIGQTAFVPKFWEKYKAMGSDNIIRIVPKDNVQGGYIYAYLTSKIGTLALWKLATGGVQPFITDSMVGSLPIPKFPEEFQKEVDSLVQESARLREEAANALTEAVAYFDSLYTIKDDKTKTFSKKVNNFSLGGLFAAYNNNLEVDEFIGQYENQSVTIRELTSKVFAPPLFKHIYLSSDNGYPFMTGSELTQFNLRYYRWLSPRGVKDINEYVVHEGDLLLYKSGTTDGGILGNVFIADKKLDGCCLSDHVIRMFFKEKPMAYWTFAFLRSKGAKEMLKRLATGSMIPFITTERLSDLRIPLPNDKFDRIVNLISTYISLNSKSKDLEEKSIVMVESEIERWAK